MKLLEHILHPFRRRFRMRPRIVLEFKGDGNGNTTVGLSVIYAKNASEGEKKLMALYLWAIGRGFEERFKEMEEHPRKLLEMSLQADTLARFLVDPPEEWPTTQPTHQPQPKETP